MSAAAASSFLRIEKVSKRYEGSDAPAVDSVSLDIQRGEFFSLLGASGSGKTTLLRMLAGFETPDSGHVFIDGRDVTDLPPYERPVNMMFQSYALFPHMSVAENVAFGLKQDGMARPERETRVRELLDLVRLGNKAGRKPHQLSGGERQRVALARALAKHPKLLLLDEPLGALDRKLRESTQFELKSLQARLGITFVMVTHDQDEAMTLSSRLAVMDQGRVLQVGAPHEVYESPATRHVAEFLGAANLLDAAATGVADGYAALALDGLPGAFKAAAATPPAAGARLAVAIRPEKIRLCDAATAADNKLQGKVKDVAYIGDVSTYNIQLANGRMIRVQTTNAKRGAAMPAEGAELWLSWDAADAVVIPE
ncbi:MAG: ABC transporter ATP-binding protein [Alphaproteobacteria bacterium]